MDQEDWSTARQLIDKVCPTFIRRLKICRYDTSSVSGFCFESIVSSSDVDPESLNPDPDPAFQVNPYTDPEPGF